MLTQKAESRRLKKLLLLDLDETLVHSENFAENTPYDFIVDFMDLKGTALDVRNMGEILIFRVSEYILYHTSQSTWRDYPRTTL